MTSEGYAYTEQRRGCASKQDSGIYHGEACDACMPVQRETFTFPPQSISLTCGPVLNYTEVTRCVTGSR